MLEEVDLEVQQHQVMVVVFQTLTVVVLIQSDQKVVVADQVMIQTLLLKMVKMEHLVEVVMDQQVGHQLVDLLDIKQIQQLLHLHKVIMEVMDILTHLTMVEAVVVVPVPQMICSISSIYLVLVEMVTIT